jgi:hypothetical protein
MDPYMGQGRGVAAQNDAADLQRLIRYVERWRMANFQRSDASPADDVDARLLDADALLRKLHKGLQLAVEGQTGATNTRQNVFIY